LAQFLAAKQQHEALQPKLMKFVGTFRRHRPAEIDTMHFGADMLRQQGDFQSHLASSHQHDALVTRGICVSFN
jgi:hypothetical protein